MTREQIVRAICHVGPRDGCKCADTGTTGDYDMCRIVARHANALLALHQRPETAQPVTADERRAEVARAICCPDGCKYLGDSEDGSACYCDTSDFRGSGVERQTDAVLALTALERQTPDAEIVVFLRTALERIASSEAMTGSFAIPRGPTGEELKARIQYARDALSIVGGVSIQPVIADQRGAKC